MSRAVTFLFLAAAAVAASSCGSRPTSPSDVALRVTVRVNPTFVGDPSTANFSIAAENISQNVLDLTFPSGCQLLPYFLERTTRRAVTPVGGGFACLTVITRATLRPGESIASNVLVKSGSSPNPAYVVLPPGDYVIYGRVEDQLFKAKSEELAFAVR